MSPNIMCVRSLTQHCMHSKGGWDVYKLSTRPTCYAHAVTFVSALLIMKQDNIKSDSSRLKMQLPNYVIENSSNMDVVAGNCMLK